MNEELIEAQLNSVQNYLDGLSDHDPLPYILILDNIFGELSDPLFYPLLTGSV